MSKNIMCLLGAAALAITMTIPSGIVNADNSNSATVDTNEEIRIQSNESKLGTFEAGSISTKYPDETMLVINKLKTEDENIGTTDHNGGELSNTSEIGNSQKGKVFIYYKVSAAEFEAMTKDPSKFSDEEKVKANFPDLVGIKADPTDEKGKAIVNILAKDYGYYWFIEEGMKDAAGIPFGITLPLTNTEKITADGHTYEAGTVYLDTIHIYPKNIVKPETKPEGGGGGGGDETKKFRKVSDEGEKPLAGVKFVVKTRSKDKDGNYIYTAVQRDGKDYIVTTDQGGNFYVSGPKDTVYYLFEVEPADRHATLTAPIECKLGVGDKDDVTIVENKTIEKPPEPEKPGTPPEPNNPENPEGKPPGGGGITDKPETPEINTPKQPESGRTKITMPDTGDVVIYFMVAVGVVLIYLGRRMILENA